jgi:hypothetical protein
MSQGGLARHIQVEGGAAKYAFPCHSGRVG